MKLIPFFTILALALGANFYVFYRLWCMMPAVLIGRILLVVFALIVLSSLILGMMAGNSLPSPIISFMYRTGTSWLFIFIYLLIIFLLLDLLRMTHLLPVHNLMYGSWRAFRALAGVMTVVMSLGYLNYLNKRRVELNLTVNKEVRTGEVLKIVAISDLHLGYGINKKEFEQWMVLINKEEPDVVLIAGDAIDNNLRPLYEQDMAPVFKQFKTRYGVYAVPGNHEYISGISQSIAFLKEAGVHLLMDSVALVNDRFYIAGRDDRMNGRRKSVRDLVTGLDPTKPIIMMDHQPYHLEEAEKNNIDLQLSGHTHHGQVFPFSLITNQMYEKSHGYLQKGNAHIYVSSGLGIWGGKFRIGTQSEYAVINLHI